MEIQDMRGQVIDSAPVNGANSGPVNGEFKPSISADTIMVCLEVLSSITISVGAPNAVVQVQRLSSALQELSAIVSNNEGQFAAPPNGQGIMA